MSTNLVRKFSTTVARRAADLGPSASAGSHGKYQE